MYELTYLLFAADTCSTEEEDVMKEGIDSVKVKLKNKTTKRYETLNKKANYDDWIKLFAMSKYDAVIPSTAEEKSDRIVSIYEVLVEFCDKSDISIDNLNINVEQLFIALNKKMEEEPSISAYLNKNKVHDFTKRSFTALVVGSSYSPQRINKDTLFKTPDALAEILINADFEVLTIGRSGVDERKGEHFQHAMGSLDENAQDTLVAGLNKLLERKLKGEKLVVFFTLAVHDAASNVRITDSFCDAFNACSSIQALKADQRVSVVVTGTDAILPSSSPTFYKVPGVGPTGFSPAGYSFSKLYQIIKGAILIAEGVQLKALTEQLAKLEKVMATADASNRFAYLQKNQFSADDIKTYDTIVNEVLKVLEGEGEGTAGVRGFSWVKDLSVLYTSMHVDRFIAASRSASSSDDLDQIVDKICDNVIFRAKNALTPHRAAFHHIEAALRAIKHDDAAANSVEESSSSSLSCSVFNCTAN